MEDKWTQRPAALKLATDAEDLRTFKQNIAGSGGSTQVHIGREKVSQSLV